jgi:hypothetical protein
MDGLDRKAAISAYKERKVPAGIFAVRCAASGQRWVGKAPDLKTIQNRIWFVLRHASSTCPSLQAAWRAHGEASFAFEVIEQLEDEDDAYVRGRLLKSRLAHWLAVLDGLAI